MSSQGTTRAAKDSLRFWKFALSWVVGTFLGISIMHGFPPTRERLESWAEFAVAGLVTSAFVRLADPWLRRFKSYRSVEAKLGLNRDGRA